MNYYGYGYPYAPVYGGGCGGCGGGCGGGFGGCGGGCGGGYGSCGCGGGAYTWFIIILVIFILLYLTGRQFAV